MNWLKAMLLMVVLGAILYGVNLVLNKSAPPEAPATDGAWSANGATNPVVVTPAPTGTAPPAGTAPSSSFGHSGAPAAQQTGTAPAYGSGNVAASNLATVSPAGYTQNGPYSSNGSPTNFAPATGAPSSNPSPYPSAGNQPGGYQPATPPVVNPDAVHSTIPATPVGMAGGSENPTSPSGAGGSAGAAAFATVMEGVTATLREGRLAEALQRLTLMYDDPQLNAEQSKQLNDLLGRLAGTVVYSRQHLLLPPYEVKPGDRLETIAAEYQVPAALLAKINRIADPDHLPAGKKLKVIRGPFIALVSLEKREVTLLVQQCYAGRFTFTGVGKNAAALRGVYKVDRKSFDAPNHPSDLSRQGPPAMHHWIGFGDGFGFCAISDPSVPEDPRGLVLNSRDAEDLFDILSVGSSVVVR